MESNKHQLPPLQPSTDSRSSRISIDALLNPSGNVGSVRRPAPYETFQHQQQQPHHAYPQPQFQPVQYRNGGPSLLEERPGSAHRSESAHSSPGPYRRDRFPSVSSSSSTVTERRRPPRPKYDEEEMYFIWYHRVDLRQEWKEVRESFNAQFPNRQRSGFQGIQCKYYRFIKEKNCPTLREQRRRRSSGTDGSVRNSFHEDSPAYGVVRWTGMRFPWMKDPPPEAPR